MSSWERTALVVGAVMALAGAGLAQWATGGRAPFTGWSLDQAERRKRRRLIEQRFPLIGRWLVPVAYAVAVLGAVIFASAAFAAS